MPGKNVKIKGRPSVSDGPKTKHSVPSGVTKRDGADHHTKPTIPRGK